MSNPYSSDMPSPTSNPMQQQPAKSGGWGRTCLIIAIVLGVVGLLACGGCVGCVYWGLGQLGNQVKAQYEDNAVIQDKLGGIDSCSLNFGKSQAETAKDQQNGGNTSYLVFDVVGPNGSGVIRGSQSPSGQGIANSVLIFEGEEFPLDE